MKTRTLQVNPSFYTDSNYAKNLIKELKDDSYGLIFNEFLHEMGAILEADVLYDQIEQTKWVHADNRHLKMILHKADIGNEEFEFIPKTSKGDMLINKLANEFIKDNSQYFIFH
jgi:hypothetical protein